MRLPVLAGIGRVGRTTGGRGFFIRWYNGGMSEPTPKRRFRFGLRAMFVVTTVMAVVSLASIKYPVKIDPLLLIGSAGGDRRTGELHITYAPTTRPPTLPESAIRIVVVGTALLGSIGLVHAMTDHLTVRTPP